MPKRLDNGGELYDCLTQASLARNIEFKTPSDLPFLFWSTELGGECGEAQNIVKKLAREKYGMNGSRATVEQLADELADVIISANHVAAQFDIDLQQAVCRKFNETSQKLGFKTYISMLWQFRRA